MGETIEYKYKPCSTVVPTFGTDTALREFCQRVQEELNSGWKPLGGPCMMNHSLLTQALVKETQRP